MYRNILLLLLLFVVPLTLPGIGFGADDMSETGESDFAFDDFDDEFGDEFGDEFDDEVSGEVFDPLSGYNRVMFAINDKLYFWVLKPVAKAYNWVVPKCVRTSVSCFFKNLGFPLRFVNNLLQLKFKEAGFETARFVVNSTVGLLGFLDPARSRLNLKPSEEDFGQTLGSYGIGGGFPIVLPLLGASNLRDLLGFAGAYFLNPVSYLESVEMRTAIPAYESVNKVSLKIGIYESLKKDAMDPYTFMRDAYKQSRDSSIEE